MTFRVPSRATGLLALTTALLVATSIFAQQLAKPNASEQTTAKLVAEMVSKFHISQKPIDDKVSQALYKRMLKDLDPQKLYLLQADADEFSKFRDHLDDLIKVGDVSFARSLFSRYQKRLEERVEMAHKLIDLDHDFSIDESMAVDGDLIPFATTPNELNERWRKRIKYELLNMRLDKTELTEAKTRLHKRYDTLRKTAKATEDSEILEMYLSALGHCFDPHSNYMSAQSVEDFQIQMKLSLEGIGAALRSEDGYTVVAQVVPGGAAEKDGRLKVKDKIVAVAQDTGEFVDIVEMKLSRVVRLIRGPKNSKVRLRVVTEANETVTYDLVRQTIELTGQEVKGEIIDLPNRVPGATGKIGVVNIPSFYRDFAGAQEGEDNFKSTARDVLAALEKFKRAGGVDCVVIDLRINGGGALSEAIEVTGLFIDKGPVVQVKEQNGRVKSLDDEERGVAYDGPLVVLCNRLSASASEIFAAAIKDYRRGIVVGDLTTHGKGTVQNVMPVSNRMFTAFNNQNLGAMKLTINQFYRVNGDSTQNRGVESDVVLPSLLDHMDLGESFLDNALAFDQIPAAAHPYFSYVNPTIVTSLQQASSQRVAQDARFQQVQKDITRYLERKNRKTVSLNEETLVKEREEDKAADELAKQEEEAEMGTPKDKPVFAKSEYNDEVLRIAADYTRLLRSATTAAK